MIEVRGLTKKFGKHTAVDNISFHVPEGSFYGFLGPNGAGKTTTVRMLCGLLQPTSGDIFIKGSTIRTKDVQWKRLIGVVTENLLLFNRLTIWEHVTMTGGIYGLSKKDTECRGDELLDVLNLWEYRGTYAMEASLGMRKKLALAIALIHNPAILFLDDALAGIDPVSIKTIRDLLIRLSEKGITIFLTSHTLELTERLADRVGVIVKGKIVAEETLLALKISGQRLENFFLNAVGEDNHQVPGLSWLL